MKRVGPELKMPDLKNAKVPPFLSDLYYDLHDRRLLPLVGLVLVAIVAVPFLLGGGSDMEEGLSPAPVRKRSRGRSKHLHLDGGQGPAWIARLPQAAEAPQPD